MIVEHLLPGVKAKLFARSEGSLLKELKDTGTQLIQEVWPHVTVHGSELELDSEAFVRAVKPMWCKLLLRHINV